MRSIFRRLADLFRRRPKGPAVDVVMLGADASVRMTFRAHDGAR